MTDKHGLSSRAQRNQSLRRRAAAASAGVLLGAFAIVAASAHRSGNQVGANPAPAAAVVAASSDPTLTPLNAVPGSVVTSEPSVRAGNSTSQSGSSTPLAPVHGMTRQS